LWRWLIDSEIDGGLSYLIVLNELVVPFDLQDTFHMECLKGSGIGIEKSPSFGCVQ